MEQRQDCFIRLSEALTGVGYLEIVGTGMVDVYLRLLDTLPMNTCDELLAAYEGLPTSTDGESGLASKILSDPKLGPVARNLIVLWYSGTWTKLPDAWRNAYGASPEDSDHVVSADSYQSGLQWVLAGAHPSGAREQGYGAWALAPEKRLV